MLWYCCTWYHQRGISYPRHSSSTTRGRQGRVHLLLYEDLQRSSMIREYNWKATLGWSLFTPSVRIHINMYKHPNINIDIWGDDLPVSGTPVYSSISDNYSYVIHGPTPPSSVLWVWHRIFSDRARIARAASFAAYNTKEARLSTLRACWL